MEFLKSGRGGKRPNSGPKPDGHKRCRLMLISDYEHIYKNISLNYEKFETELEKLLKENENRKINDELKKVLKIIGIDLS